MRRHSPYLKCRGTRRTRAAVDRLEPRQLLAVVNVTDFGAIPNDSGDDRAAIQAAIDAAGSGGTIQFPAGNFRVSGNLHARSNRTYVGVTAFHCPDWTAKPLSFVGTAHSRITPTGEFAVFRVEQSNLTFRQLTLEGRGIYMHGGSNPINNIVIDNNWFAQPNGSPAQLRGSVWFDTLLTNSRITNNVFNPIKMENGIWGYYWNNLLIANNAFIDGIEGMHLINHDDKGRDLVIEQNYFANLRRMAIEYQAGGWNTVVQDNHYENPVLTSNVNQNLDTFAYSIVADRSQNTITRRNTAIAPERPDGYGVRVMFELGGFNIQCYDNYSIGGYNSIAVNGTRATGVARDNRISNYLNGPYNANGATAQFANNNGGVGLTWNPSRGRPGPNHRLGNPLPDPDPQPEPDPDPDPPPPPPPDANIPGAPSNLSGKTLGLSQLELNWSDGSTTELGFQVERLSEDGVTWLVVGTIAANVTTFQMSHLASARTYTFRVRAFNEAGFSGASNVAELRMPLSDTSVISGPTSPVSTRPKPTSPFRSGDGKSIVPVIVGDI
jgi:hypothetical protein